MGPNTRWLLEAEHSTGSVQSIDNYDITGKDEFYQNWILVFQFWKMRLQYIVYLLQWGFPYKKQFWFRSTDSITNYLRVKYVLILLHLQVMELKIWLLEGMTEISKFMHMMKERILSQYSNTLMYYYTICITFILHLFSLYSDL